jgi:hypothetical protein
MYRPSGAGLLSRCPVCGQQQSRREAVSTQEAGDDRSGEPPEAGGLPGAGSDTAPRWDEDVFESGSQVIVCTVSRQRANPLEIGPIVAAFTGLPKVQARMQMKQGMGILADGIEVDTARNLMEALSAQGLEVFAVPAEAVGPPGGRKRFFAVYCADEDGLYLQVDQAGAVERTEWSDVWACAYTRVASGGSETVEDLAGPRRMLLTRGGVVRGHRAGMRVVRHEAEAEVSVVTRGRGGKPGRLVLTEGSVHYAYLGERMTTSRHGNFTLFLGDIARWAEWAVLGEGFRWASDGHLGHPTSVVGKQDYENYLRWLMCCAVARRQERQGGAED